MKVALTIATILISSVIITSQENQTLQAQQVVLDTPDVISLKLAPVRRASVGIYQQASGPFTPENKIKFALVATNTALISLPVRSWDQFAQNRPRLLRKNQEVVYRHGLSDLLKTTNPAATS